jgi:RNA polymerase sigma factor (sigma-70 family)
MAGPRAFRSEDSDKVLVRRFARQHDGEAFSILMDRYADMVYTTCWRMLGDEALAADAVQETFFQLVKNAEKITGSLGSWLHKVATRRSVDLIRQNVSRRNREESYVLDADAQGNSWSELQPVVDEALEELPENLREVLLLHFMQGRSTIQIAASQGVSQPTISRRLAQALDLLRKNLRERGIMAGVVPVQAVLLHSNYVTPEAVRVSLGKIALAKAVGIVPTKIAIAAGVVALATGAFLLSMPERNKPKVVGLPKPQASDPTSNSAENVKAKPESAPVKTAVVAEASQAPPPIPAPTPLSPPQPAPQQRAQAFTPPSAKPAPPTNSLAPRASLPPAIASSTPVNNNWNRNRGPSVPIRPANVPAFRQASVTAEFDWIPSLYKPPPERLINQRSGSNYISEPRIVQNPTIIPNARRAFAPARNSGPAPPWSVPASSPKSGKTNKAN